MSEINAPMTYDRKTVMFHWVTAALVVVIWLLAQSEGLIPRAGRHAMWSIHIALAACLIVLFGARLLWRATAGRRLPSVNSGLLLFIERAVHGGLYLLLAAVLALGVVNVLARGWDLFGLIQIPAFAADDRALRRAINGWHELAANALIGLAVLHAGAALAHQFLWRDGLLNRMRLTKR